nr:hypothetical protein [Tanacetum cinerariifolium]
SPSAVFHNHKDDTKNPKRVFAFAGLVHAEHTGAAALAQGRWSYAPRAYPKCLRLRCRGPVSARLLPAHPGPDAEPARQPLHPARRAVGTQRRPPAVISDHYAQKGPGSY